MRTYIVFGWILLLAGTGCRDGQNIGHDTVLLHYRYMKPGTDTPFEGLRSFHYDSGELSKEAIYNDGYPEVVIYYYRSGHKKSRIIVGDGGKGKIIGHVEWYKTGRKSFESYGGITKEWFKNGQLKALVHYNENNELHGVTKIWYRDGSLKGRESYRFSRLHGERARWNEKGQKVMSEYYRNGRLTETIEL